MASMREVAKLAGVSISTVSVVLDSKTDKYVSEENREKVNLAVEKLGYKLPEKKDAEYKKTIAVILPVITSAFFPNILAGIGKISADHGYSLLYCDTNNSFKKEQEYLKLLKKQTLKGIIIDSLCFRDNQSEYLKILKEEFITKRKIPVVFLERRVDDNDFYSISVDDYQNAYQATKYLIDCGHKRIAHISGNNAYDSSGIRLIGYKDALMDCGIEFDEKIVVSGQFTPISGYSAMKSLLTTCSDFTALFSANDQMAIGAMKAIKESGRSIPEDVAVVGFDNINQASIVDPSLTTINVPTYQMGCAAAQTIVDVHNRKPVQKIQCLSANLIIRKSSNNFATNEWDLMGW